MPDISNKEKAMEYRLGKYRITDSGSSMLWWEAHFPLAMQRRGKCFLIGDILIIGRTMHEENGYLILEFQEHLEKLPVWDKTAYYCYASNLLDAASGENLSEDFLQRKMFLSEMNNEDKKPVIGLKQGRSRLGQYQIIVTDNNRVQWQALEGADKLIGGRCIIESEVLFIGPREYAKGRHDKETFVSALEWLPQWDNTFAWCKSMVLQACRPDPQTNRSRPVSRDRDKCGSAFYRDPSADFRNRSAGPLRRSLLQGLNWLKTSWQRIHAGRLWLKHLLPNADAFRTVGLNIKTRGRLLNILPSASIQSRYRGAVRRTLQSGLIWFKPFWLRIQPGKFAFKCLIPLIVVGSLLGLAFLLLSREKKLSSPHYSDNERHHEHDDDKD